MSQFRKVQLQKDGDAGKLYGVDEGEKESEFFDIFGESGHQTPTFITCFLLVALTLFPITSRQPSMASLILARDSSKVIILGEILDINLVLLQKIFKTNDYHH